MQRKYDYIFKFVIIGSSSVGKSSILKRFADDQFEDSYVSTIGIDFRFKSLMVDDSYVKLQIWDTAGQERFRGITKSYYKGAQAIILVYDVNNEKSFEDIRTFWLKECRANSEKAENIFIFVNKCDDPEMQIPQAHQQFFTGQNIEYFKVSAKKGMNIGKSILFIAQKMMEIYPKANQDKLGNNLKQTTASTGSRRRCCNGG